MGQDVGGHKYPDDPVMTSILPEPVCQKRATASGGAEREERDDEVAEELGQEGRARDPVAQDGPRAELQRGQGQREIDCKASAREPVRADTVTPSQGREPGGETVKPAQGSQGGRARIQLLRIVRVQNSSGGSESER